MPEKKTNYWWFGFKQVIPEPAGMAIACGPYDTSTEALRKGSEAKTWDCQISAPFRAGSQSEADKKANEIM